MEEHYVLPEGSDELKLVGDRILELSAAVLTPADWLNLLSAAETVLPKENGKRIKPSNLNLVALQSQPQMVLFAKILQAVGSEKTYKTSRRYRLGDWLRIALKFSDLSLYVVPPARLDYAVELCLAAIDGKAPMDSIMLVNALSEVDVRVVRQLVSEEKINQWSSVLIGHLQENCQTGEDIQTHNGEGGEPYHPDDYDKWLSESETLVDVASNFYAWSDKDESEELRRLRRLIDSVDPPPDPEAPEDEDREFSRASSPSSYWTLERMFEDL